MQYVSQILTKASGSAAGTTWSHNQHTKYIRARTTPTDPKTVRQRTQRRAMVRYAIWWRTLVDNAQRRGWETYAANVTMLNAIGQPGHLTGRDHFMRSHMALAFLANPPLFIGQFPVIFSIPTFTSPIYSASAATQIITIDYNGIEIWRTENNAFGIFYLSRPQTPSVNFWAGPYRYLTDTPGYSGGPWPQIKNVPAPDVIAPGQHLFFYARVSRADRRLSSRLQGTCTVGT